MSTMGFSTVLNPSISYVSYISNSQGTVRYRRRLKNLKQNNVEKISRFVRNMEMCI